MVLLLTAGIAARTDFVSVVDAREPAGCVPIGHSCVHFFQWTIVIRRLESYNFVIAKNHLFSDTRRIIIWHRSLSYRDPFVLWYEAELPSGSPRCEAKRKNKEYIPILLAHKDSIERFWGTMYTPPPMLKSSPSL